IEFALPVAGSQPRGIALGSDGNLWFTESRTSGTATGYIGRITPAGAITEFAVPHAWSRPFLITSGPDGNMWFSDEGTNSVGTITVAGAGVGVVTEVTLPSASAAPRSTRTHRASPSGPTAACGSPKSLVAPTAR